MADKIPLKVNTVSGQARSLQEFGPTDTIGISNGGTGATTAQEALNNLSQVAAYSVGYVLTKDSFGNATWQPSAGGGGGGVWQPLLVSGTNIKTINGNTILGSGDLAIGGGSGSNFIAAGSGAVTRTMQNKARDFISVLDFGAVRDGVTDDAAAFQAAIAAVGTLGGRIVVPFGHYVLNTAPNIGTKSVFWDFDTGCIFTGTGTGHGKFPYMQTNIAQMAVGPYIACQSPEHSTHPNGGIAAFNVEMGQPDSYGAGQSVGIYVGAYSNNVNAAGNSWAMNALLSVGPLANGVHQCIEVDVDCESSTALVKGISLSGGGAANPDVAVEITRMTGVWDKGIDIYSSTIGIRINSSTVSCGIAINNPGQTNNTPLAIKQQTNTGDAIFLQRFSNAAGGYLIRGVDETNTFSVFGITGFGQGVFASLVAGSGATSQPAGFLCIGNSNAASASSGGASLPGNPAGFLAWFYGSSTIKVPYYNN